MSPARRQEFDELLRRLQTGRISRRSFFDRTLALGFSAVAADSLLASCGDGSGMNSGKDTIHLIWQSEFDTSTAYQEIIEHFNRTNPDNIHVTVRMIQGGTNDLTALERNMLRAGSAAVDLFSVDIVMVPEFASRQWIKPISESQWPAAERAKYLSAPIQGCTFNNQIWAVPYRTDIGLLYYRTDLVDKPPETWDDLVRISRQVIAARPEDVEYGYVWQASQYEGLICNFEEVLHGYGGSILDPNDSRIVTVDSPEARAALSAMVEWIHPSSGLAISPADISTYTEEVTRLTWEKGRTLFMRNWPYAYSHTRQLWLADKFAIHPLLYGGDHATGHSSVGGWQLAINAFIAPEKQHAAWKFIQYMLGREAQELGARKASWLVSLKEIYQDAGITQAIPLFKEIMPILENALPRPRTPRYDDFSLAVRIRLRQALNKAPIDETLQQLAAELAPLVASTS